MALQAPPGAIGGDRVEDRDASPMPIALEYGLPTRSAGLNVQFGIANGFFAAEGIDLRARVVFGGPEIAAAYDSGALGIGELGTPPGLTAIGQGLRFKIVGSGFSGGLGLFFLVRSDIVDWSDFAGKTFGALSTGSCSYWYLREMLAQHGLDPDRAVSIRSLGADYPRQLDLLARGEIAGLLTTEPLVTIGETRGTVRDWGNVLDLADVPHLQWSVQVANDDILQHEPDLVRDVLRIARDASRHLSAHPDEWIDFYARLCELTPEMAARAIARERATLNFGGRLDRDGLARAVALQAHLGSIAGELPVTAFVAEGFEPPPVETAAASVAAEG